MKKEMVAMILAGGRGTRLEALTTYVAKPAVYFGGKYRIIDFPLSNCTNSGIDTVGILTQYESVLLGSYIGNGQKWGLDGRYSDVSILPAREKAGIGKAWYQGTADAIYQNLEYLDAHEPEYVLILSGDHIYKMNYAKMLDAHKENNADCTIAVLNVSLDEASRFGIMNTLENGMVYEFEEKPQNPKSTLASMGIYIFNYQALKKYLVQDACKITSHHDFGMDIIPSMLADQKKLYAYQYLGYWKDVGTIESLWQANIDLLSDNTLDLYNQKREWKIYSDETNTPPQIVGETGNIKNSMTTQGCVIDGLVEGSILFDSVKVGPGARIIDSVLMPGVCVGENAVIYKSIIDENVKIDANALINEEAITVKLVSNND